MVMYFISELTDMVAAARQSMSLMLSGIRNAPVSHNHMRVLEIDGEDATQPAGCYHVQTKSSY